MKFFLAACVLMWLLAGCGRQVEPAPDYPNDRGELLGDLNQLVPDMRLSYLLDWSRDGTELYYLCQRANTPVTELQLYAFRFATRTARRVAAGSTWQLVPLTGPGLIRQSLDGQYFYLKAGNPMTNRYRLYRVPLRQSAPVTVLDSATLGSSQQPLLSPDGTWLGFAPHPDSVRLARLGSAAVAQFAGWGLQALSPDAGQVLLSSGQPNQWDLVARAGFSRTPLLVDASLAATGGVGATPIYPAFWSPAGFMVLYESLDSAGNIRLNVQDLVGQSGKNVWVGRDHYERLLDSWVSLSPDGRRAAFWTQDIRSPRSLNQESPRTLYVVDLVSGRTAVGATLAPSSATEGATTLNWALISYDNSRLVYNFDGKLYLLSLP